MLLRFATFTDPMYSADKFVEFDPMDVLFVEEKQVSLLMRGHFWTTRVKLKSGASHALNGRVAAQIEAARREARI